MELGQLDSSFSSVSVRFDQWGAFGLGGWLLVYPYKFLVLNHQIALWTFLIHVIQDHLNVPLCQASQFICVSFGDSIQTSTQRNPQISYLSAVLQLAMILIVVQKYLQILSYGIGRRLGPFGRYQQRWQILQPSPKLVLTTPFGLVASLVNAQYLYIEYALHRYLK